MSLNFLIKTFEEEKPLTLDKKGPSLKGLLQRERLKLKKKVKPRELQLNFNPSLITYGYCKRMKVAQLAELTSIYRDVPTPKMQLMFDMGNAIHDIVHGYFWDIGILEGLYRCYSCSETWWDISPKSCKCGKRSRRIIHYQEVPLTSEEYLISGRADGILHFSVEDLVEKHLVDIKSIGNRGPTSGHEQYCFEDIKQKGAKAAHIVQLNLYMWMAKIHKGHILYVSKNSHQVESIYLEHDFQIIKPHLDEIKAIQAWAADVKLKIRKLPEPCANKKCKCETVVA